MKKFTVLILTTFFSLLLQAQDAQMADTMRGNGKIYVVIAVMVTIFLGIVLYLVRLDSKISKLEKNNSSNL